MTSYRVPRRDIRFLLHELFDAEGHYGALEAPASVDRELFDAILDEAAKFAENELAPLNRSGDETGCRFENGVVTTPPGFKEAYRSYIAGGWASIVGDPAYGGQGLPPSLNMLAIETRTSANQAWSMYPDLSHGAMNALHAHASEAQKHAYLTPLLSGEWTGTMCLTEPQAGSDLGLLRTGAEPRADGSYAITGTKIFISAGEHDLAENIVHLVLARLPDAPAGTRGLSLFIVPKFLPDAEGKPGPRNGVRCGSIEEKMGIHGNATCLLNFDEATGFLLGEENKGMRCMFTMMNTARVAVGMQGLGAAECCYQASLDYARERLQMRALSGPRNPDGPADAIIEHPDVRRMLLTQKAFIEGGRALAYYTALQADVLLWADSEALRAEAQAEVDFLTPIVKGFLTELGFESASLGLQIFGGHGYIRENGIEQYLRDSRITIIYEGTTQIQALDLLGRKTLMNGAETLERFLAKIAAVAGQCDERLPDMAAALRRLVEEWRELAAVVAERAGSDTEEVGAAALDFLMYGGYALLAWLWARMALRADAALAETAEGSAEAAFLSGKLATARFYFERMLPRADAHRRAALAGAAPLMTPAAESFDHR